MVRCGACKFWQPFNDNVGECRRAAPLPAETTDTVAHWPETFAGEGCGDGQLKAGATTHLTCAECAFWMTTVADGGMQPVDYNDQPREWWRHAGRCMRHAPAPRATPGLRLSWPATHGRDSCGEGHPRAPRTPVGDDA